MAKPTRTAPGGGVGDCAERWIMAALFGVLITRYGKANREAPLSLQKTCSGGGQPMKKLSVALLIVMVLALAVEATDAGNGKRRSLEGLTGVQVVVEGLGAEVEGRYLRQQQIQTDVELRLRKAGIRVLTEEESSEAPGTPYLYVNVNLQDRAYGSADQPTTLVYSIEVSLNQTVQLVRDPAIVVSASTWKAGLVGTAGTSGTKHIRDVTGDLVDMFINDYLAANPKKRTRVPTPGWRQIVPAHGSKPSSTDDSK